MIIEVLASIAGGILCWWLNYTGEKHIGACTDMVTLIRDLWSELLTAVLALLVAARPGPPPDKSNDDETGQ